MLSDISASRFFESLNITYLVAVVAKFAALFVSKMESGGFTDNSSEETCPSEETEEETESEADVDLEGNVNVSAKGAKKKGKKKNRTSRESLKEATSSRLAGLRRSANKKDALRMSQGLSLRSSENSRKASRRISQKKPAQTKKGKKARFFGEIEDAVEREPEIPEGLIPILLSIKTQEHFGLRIGEDVTADDPQKFILKRDIMQDIEDFKEKSDFNSIIDMIQDYTAEEFLIVYDHEFKYGQNFFITVSEDARDMFAKDSLISELEDFAMDFFGPYEAPKPKQWTTLGSEKEIQDWTVTNQRDYIKMVLRREVKYFGAPTNFSDSNPVESKNFVDVSSVPVESFELRRMEVDVGVQAVPEFSSHHTQKIQGLMVNKVVQCMPRELSEEEAQAIMESPELEDFFNRIIPRVDKELQQNKIVDVFFDDWDRLSDGDTDFAAKSEKHLKEHQSFTDLQYGKSRAVSCITWHPTIPLIVAVSLIDNVTLYERIEQSHKQFTPPLILIWNFSDPIHPILVLECPEQVMCFQFCPTNPAFVVGGCFNGQVVLWDLSYHTERLKVLPGAKKKDILRELSAEFDWAKAQSSVRFCAISSVEHSHSLPITDILWIPSQYEINKFGYVSQNKFDHNIQLITCGIDQSIMFWDIRMPKGSLPVMTKKELQKICLIPGTFKHLDLVWRPFLKLSTSKAEIGNDYSPIKFSIAETQPIHSVDTMENVNLHGSIIMNTGIKPISSKFFIGTEEGEVLYLDWMPQKDQESGKYQTQRPVFAHQVHDGAVMSLERSPFFEDILLTVGGWNFAIWKEGINVGPIIKGYGPKRFTAGHWSSTRPAVFYLTKVDGTIDVWDLLDRTHEACYTQNISTSQITTISSIKIKTSSRQEPMHLLAIGDENGTLYLLELPWSLCNPSLSELANMTAYLDREVKHLAYVNSRWVVRDDERIKQDLEMKRMKNQEAEPPPPPSEEELEAKDRMEYDTFLEEEQAFLKLMGLIEEPPPPPPTESDKKGSFSS